MKTVTIEIKNDIALKFLYNLESLHIIRFIKKPERKKLSERFSGCISDEKANELHNELIKMREEWDRDI